MSASIIENHYCPRCLRTRPFLKAEPRIICTFCRVELMIRQTPPLAS